MRPKGPAFPKPLTFPALPLPSQPTYDPENVVSNSSERERGQVCYKVTDGRQISRRVDGGVQAGLTALSPGLPKMIQENQTLLNHGGQITTATFTYWQEPAGCKQRQT